MMRGKTCASELRLDFSSDWKKKVAPGFSSQSCSVVDAKRSTFQHLNENRSRAPAIVYF